MKERKGEKQSKGKKSELSYSTNFTVYIQISPARVLFMILPLQYGSSQSELQCQDLNFNR